MQKLVRLPMLLPLLDVVSIDKFITTATPLFVLLLFLLLPLLLLRRLPLPLPLPLLLMRRRHTNDNSTAANISIVLLMTLLLLGWWFGALQRTRWLEVFFLRIALRLI